ncbi:outer mitochondrial membrane transport complex protein-domain-containing protein [Phycomyces nitens]|nr:outer mitochondrial membrane transport complex protein-domain-containing protein [Phycomyces nitens]
MSLQLYVWSPALDAPSIDPKCIVAEAYLRMLNKPYTVVHSNDPQTSPTGELPLLKDGAVWIAGLDRIIAHLTKKDVNGNHNLNPDQKADSLAYDSLVQEKLYDVMLFTWYADMTNFVKSIRPVYGQILSFPSRYLVPVQLKKSAQARLAKYNVEIIADDVGLPQNEIEEMKELQRTGWHHMYQLARDVYGTLDKKLGDQKYMFGEEPSTLDCIVFGYLALHLYPNLAHRRLQHILKEEYPRLAQYCDRFKDEYFVENQTLSSPAPDIPSVWSTLVTNPRNFFSVVKDELKTESEPEKKKKSEEEIDFERKRVWSIAGGVTFLFAYVIFNGIVSVELEE